MEIVTTQKFTQDDIIELEYSADEIKSINLICKYYPMSMETCYQICALMGPICDRKSPSGAIEWLKAKIKEDKV